MPTYEKANEEVYEMADAILDRFQSHEPLVRCNVKIDILFAHPNCNEDGEPTGDAIRKHGVKALGLCRVVNLKDRTKGLGDVEILLDYDWWSDASKEQRMALLDHELHHAEVKMKDGKPKIDAAGRPQIKLRKHDVEIGWFDIIALRHGAASQERIQARELTDGVGQLYWPDLCGEPTPEKKLAVLSRYAGPPPEPKQIAQSLRNALEEDDDGKDIIP